jgi:hypothetical protein
MIETLIAFGKKKQTAIGTANVLADFWSLRKLNAALSAPTLSTENDAAEFGKGNDWATAVFNVAWDQQFSLEKYLSAEIAAWAFSYGLGKVVKSGAGPFTYTITPLDPNAGDAIELPYFSLVEQIRATASVIDRMSVGCAVEGFTIAIGSGPGRANSKITIQCQGSGILTEPSGIVIPAVTAEKLLPSASLAFTANAVNYVTSKNIVSLNFSWKNNLSGAAGYYPGSGFQGGTSTAGAVRGRLEYGTRQAGLSWVARYLNGSTEWATLKAQTVFNDCVFSLTYDTNNSLTVTFPAMAISAAQIGDSNSDGLVDVAVTAIPLYSSGIISVVAKTAVDAICQ